MFWLQEPNISEEVSVSDRLVYLTSDTAARTWSAHSGCMLRRIFLSNVAGLLQTTLVRLDACWLQSTTVLVFPALCDT